MISVTTLLTKSSGPFFHTGVTTQVIMWNVALALLPAVVIAVCAYGSMALKPIAYCILFSMGLETAWQVLTRQKIRISEGTSCVTGLLLAFNLPPGTPWYMCLIGSFAAIICGKMFFGGTGKNIVNPALLGRLVLFVVFPAGMGTFVKPGFFWSVPHVDGTTGATVLSLLKTSGVVSSLSKPLDLLFSLHAGCIGEVAPLALIAGGLYLLLRGFISWHIPLAFTVGMVGMALYAGTELVLHLLSGGLLLGALFMATDYTTAPTFSGGKIIFGLGCGVLTMLIRLHGAYPEGVMFAILSMSCFVPLLDYVFQTPPIGQRKAWSAIPLFSLSRLTGLFAPRELIRNVGLIACTMAGAVLTMITGSPPDLHLWLILGTALIVTILLSQCAMRACKKVIVPQTYLLFLTIIATGIGFAVFRIWQVIFAEQYYSLLDSLHRLFNIVSSHTVVAATVAVLALVVPVSLNIKLRYSNSSQFLCGIYLQLFVALVVSLIGIGLASVRL